MSDVAPSQTRKPCRVSVLGAGVMGRLHARVFAQMSGPFSLVGVYDPDGASAREVARTWSIPAYDDESAAIDAADLVVIASPVEAHAGAARRALARGRHLLVEKPLCATAADAFALARATGRTQHLFVGHSERFNPVIRALRGLLRPSELATLRLRRASVGEGNRRERSPVLSLGVHDLDLVAYLTESAVALRDVVRLDGSRADLVLAAASGPVAWVHVDGRAALPERSIEIETSGATYRGDLLRKTLTVLPRDGRPPLECPVLDEEPLVAQATAIGQALAGGEVAVARGLDGARALALFEEASLRGRPAAERSRELL